MQDFLECQKSDDLIIDKFCKFFRNFHRFLKCNGLNFTYNNLFAVKNAKWMNFTAVSDPNLDRFITRLGDETISLIQNKRIHLRQLIGILFILEIVNLYLISSNFEYYFKQIICNRYSILTKMIMQKCLKFFCSVLRLFHFVNITPSIDRSGK